MRITRRKNIMNLTALASSYSGSVMLNPKLVKYPGAQSPHRVAGVSSRLGSWGGGRSVHTLPIPHIPGSAAHIFTSKNVKQDMEDWVTYMGLNDCQKQEEA